MFACAPRRACSSIESKSGGRPASSSRPRPTGWSGAARWGRSSARSTGPGPRSGRWSPGRKASAARSASPALEGPDRPVLGPGPHHPLQRRLPAGVRRQAPARARPAGARGVARGLVAAAEAAVRGRDDERRGVLGQRPAFHARAPRLPRRGVTSTSPTIRCATNRARSAASSASSARPRAAWSASGACGRCATSARACGDAQRWTTCSSCSVRRTRREPARRAVRVLLPRRRTAMPVGVRRRPAHGRCARGRPHRRQAGACIEPS